MNEPDAAVSFAHALRRVLSGGGIRVLGIPATAVLGLLNTSLIVTHTGSVTYGIVNTVATLGTLLPFADLGMGAVVTTAVGIAATDASHRPVAVATLRTVLRRLGLIALTGLVAVWVITLTGWWSTLFGRSFSTPDSLMIGLALSLFFLTLPAAVGARALIGLDKNHVVVALGITATGWALLSTGVLALADVRGMPYVLSGFVGTLVSHLILLAIAAATLRRHGMPLAAVTPPAGAPPEHGLLAGSGWMLVVLVGLPLGLETGRLILAHRAGAIELSEFALAAQLYALTWSVISVSGQALWPVFARQRAAADASGHLWRQMVALFGAAALVGGGVLVAVGPWFSGVVSRGALHVDRPQMLAFALLLLVQALHLPGGVLLTRPEELRWQACCVVGMAAISVTISVSLAPTYAGVAVTGGAALGVLLAQLVPDILMVDRMLRRRPEASHV